MKTTTILLLTMMSCLTTAGVYSYKYGMDGSKASKTAVNPSNPDYISVNVNGREELYKARHPSVSCIQGEFYYDGRRQPGLCQQYKGFKPYNMTEAEFLALVKVGMKISH